jgi:hypothetical protein
MNSSKTQTEINKLMAETKEAKNELYKKGFKNQFKVTKKNVARLTELGLIEFMPSKFDQMDAEAVLNAATGEAQYGWKFNLPGKDGFKHDLQKAIEEVVITRNYSGTRGYIHPMAR